MTKASRTNDLDSILVSASQLADLLKVTLRRIPQLVDEGVLPRPTKGSYPLAACVRARVKQLGDLAERTAATEEERNSRRRVWAAKAEKVELDLAERRGDLASISTFQAQMTDTFRRLQNRLLGIGHKAAPRLAATKSPTACCQIVDAEVRAALAELASADIKPPANGNGKHIPPEGEEADDPVHPLR